MAIRFQPTSLLPAQSSGVAQGTALGLFNAGLAYQDEKGASHPHLGQTLPTLGTESWRVFPDGQMETTYRLKPNLLWHDDTVATADDFEFAHEVFQSPGFGVSGSAPFSLMGSVTAPTHDSIVVRWKRPYVDAGNLGDKFTPLPRHALESSLRENASAAFLLKTFWTREYVGLGPYRVTAWEPGSHIDATAFAGYILGAPKIERVRLQFMSDANVIVAGLLGGSVDVVLDNGIRPEQGAALQRQWAADQGVVVNFPSGSLRYVYVQLAPEKAQPMALLDLRVRKALAFGIDKPSLVAGLSEGLSLPADTLVVPTAPEFPVVDTAVPKYPYDPRRVELLMAEAGFVKGADAFFTSPASGSFVADHQVNAGNPQYLQEQAILVETWRRAGFDLTSSVLPTALQQDGQIRASFPGLASTLCPCGTSATALVSSREIPRPETRWLGNNRGHWSNREFDQLVVRFEETLDRGERATLAARLMKQVAEELPGFPLYYDVTTVAHTADLQGPIPGARWNIHLWHWRSPISPARPITRQEDASHAVS